MTKMKPLLFTVLVDVGTYAVPAFGVASALLHFLNTY